MAAEDMHAHYQDQDDDIDQEEVPVFCDPEVEKHRIEAVIIIGFESKGCLGGGS
jgi:hypothetical protein